MEPGKTYFRKRTNEMEGGIKWLSHWMKRNKTPGIPLAIGLLALESVYCKSDSYPTLRGVSSLRYGIYALSRNMIWS